MFINRLLILILGSSFLFFSCKKKKEEPDCSVAPLTADFTMSTTDRNSNEAGDWKGVMLYAYQLGWKDESLENDTLFSPYIYLNANEHADEYKWTVTQVYEGKVYTRSFMGKSCTASPFLEGKATVTLQIKKFNTKCKEIAPLETSASKSLHVSKFHDNSYPGDSTICTVGYSYNGKYKGVFDDKPNDTIIVEFSNCNPILFNDLPFSVPTRRRYIRVIGLSDSCIISPENYNNYSFTTNQIYMEDKLYKKCYFVRTYLTFTDKDKKNLKAVVSYSSFNDEFTPNPSAFIRTFTGKRQ